MEKLSPQDLKNIEEKEKLARELARRKRFSMTLLFIGLGGLFLVAMGFIVCVIVYYVIYSNLFI